jgi:4a-hydroxytetrahydrobiopterin dehydratase
MTNEQPTVPVLLSLDQVKSQLANLEGWDYDSKKLKISREFRFKSFEEAAAFVIRIFLIAERMDHHPEITNVYHTVEIKLQTHRVGGVSYLDIKQAGRINEMI